MWQFTKTAALVGGAILMLCAPAARGIDWNEAVNGDLSSDPNHPTSIGALSAGTNSITATSQFGDQDDFTFSIPAGATLSAIYPVSYNSPDGDDTSFIAIASGTTVPDQSQAPANLLGWTHFGPSQGNMGVNIMPAMGSNFGAIGFTPPLGSGNYSIWMQQAGSPATFRMDFVMTPAPVATGTWNVNANGNWSAAANWQGGVPNAVGAIANFGTIITSARTVNVDSAQTVGTINFSSPISYAIAGPGTLTLDVSSEKASINVSAGSHTISSPLVLNDDTTITTSAASGLSIAGNLTATGKTIEKLGAGSVQFANVRASGLKISDGSAQISAKGTPNSPSGTSVVGSLSIESNATLDLTNNSAVIDYTGSVGGLVGNTREDLEHARLITSSGDASHRLGYGDNAVLNKTNFAGQTVDASSVLIKYTFGGDSNLDGQVDVTDLGSLATNWQTTNVWTGGDFNYDGFVDVTDLGALATNWQAGVGAPLERESFASALAQVGLAAVSVPEPSMVAIFIIGLGLCRCRRRPRSN